MAKKNALKRLHKPVHPVLAYVLIALVVVTVIISALVLRSGQSSTATPQQYQAQSDQPQFIPTAIPVPVDTSSWRTFTNLADGISIKLPQQFFPQWPGRMPTPTQLNPDGSVKWSFEDFYSRNFQPTENYGFTVRINKRGHVNFNNSCTTDEQCFNILYDFYKPLPNTTIYLLHAKILDRDVKGLAIANKNGTPGTIPSDKGIIGDAYFEFTFNGKPYELNIYDIGNYEQLLMKQPYIDAIASTISFSQ